MPEIEVDCWSESKKCDKTPRSPQNYTEMIIFIINESADYCHDELIRR